jgi:hypothetical protein
MSRLLALCAAGALLAGCASTSTTSDSAYAKPVGYAYHDGLHSDWVASPSQQALYNAAHGVWLWPPTDNGRPD